jgi:uncharacterized protein (DUF2062 family)
MPRRFFTRVSRRFRKKKDHPWYLRPFEYILAHPTYFSTSRRSVGGGLWVGLFIGLLPIPGQTFVAIIASMWLRVNVPIAAATLWVTNPITVVPIFYLAYRIGAILLNIPSEPFPDEPSMAWLTEEIALRWKPLFLGAFIMALSVSSTAYLLVSVAWHVLTLRRYRRRHSRSVGSVRGGKKTHREK